MKIFQREINDGVAELVKSTASVAYCSPVSLHQGTVEAANDVIHNPEVLAKVIAENQDQHDLYYLEAVLVSTGWNKNDDVFTAKNTWAARNTPEDKQFNFMHDENDIIGHITGSYVLTKDGKAVADDDAARPDEFDIITQAVLYNSWTQAENRERMEEIIKEIPQGKWFVSMECLFAGFDYALIDPKGEAKILTRDEASAFLTKHLRAYGGTGEYEGYKIGRALSNISFSGKGLVSKPANPRSVILNSKSTASFNVNTDSKLSIGEINMSDQSLLEKQLAETKAELAKAQSEVATVKSQIEEAKDKEYASKVEQFEAAAKQAQATIDELNESIKSTQARVAELEDALAISKEVLAKAEKDMEEMKKKEEKDMEEMKKKEKMEKRKAALVEAGLDEEEVTATLASCEALDDTAFEAIAGMMKKKAGKKYTLAAVFHVKDEEADASTQASEEAAETALDDVETSEAELNVGDDAEDEIAKAQASISEWFANNVLSK
jgi:uncharacterized protein YukE